MGRRSLHGGVMKAGAWRGDPATGNLVDSEDPCRGWPLGNGPVGTIRSSELSTSESLGRVEGADRWATAVNNDGDTLHACRVNASA